MPLDRATAVKLAVQRGLITGEEAASLGEGAVSRQAGAGLIAPRLQAPDKIAERGAYIRDYGQITKDRDELGQFYPLNADLDRFHALNERASTGGWKNNIPVIKDITEWVSPDTKEMSGITSGLQGRARPAGSGATSDFEQRLYRMGVPAPEKQGPTNDNIISYQKGVLAEQNDRLAFQEEFLRQNGSLSGSQQAWARYLAANPYTVTGPDGRTRPNARRKSWEEGFGLREGAPAKPPGWSQALPKPQMTTAMMFKGSKAPGGSSQNPFTPASAAEFQALPAGAWYIDTDGRRYQKGDR